MKHSIFYISVIALLVLAPAVALADNNVTVIKPIAYLGAYGTGNGQIDTPLCVKVDSNDSVYILQDVHYATNKFKTMISVYDKNLTFVRSFYILKHSMDQVPWDPAPNGYYYDNLATSFDIDNSGNIYVLCGWDVVIFYNNGTYRSQFPDYPFMGWIDKTADSTTFYYPHGIVVTDSGQILITSGSSPQKQEFIFINPDGRLAKKIDAPVKDIYDITRDRNGSVYLTGAGSSIIHVYNATLTNETDMPLYFNGTYNGNPTSLAFFSTGNVTASANGIFIYDANGTMTAQFMDNNVSANNVSWDRPIATNSTDWLIVVSGMKDSDRTPQPIALYRYDAGELVGAPKPENNDVCTSVLAMFGFTWVLYFLVKRYGH